jgi:hypothetical protein
VWGVGGQYLFGQWVARQSVGEGRGLRGSPKVCRCARAPVAIRPLHAKNPSPSLRPPLPESLGGGGVPGWPVGGRRWPVPPLRPVGQSGSGEASRPKASLSPGVGRGCRWPKASLGQVGLRWPVGGRAGRRRPLPVPFGQWGPVGGGAKASRLWPSLCGQSGAGVRPPCMASRWPVRGRGALFPMGGRPLLWPVGGVAPLRAPVPSLASEG